MTLAKRAASLEESLTPKEAIILWMREVHEFGSLFDYGRWLIDQPDDVCPLMRMPAQVVAAVRRQHKGIPDIRLHNEFYRAQKDVLFLYYLHQQVNVRFLTEKEALYLRVILLIRQMRLLIHEKHARDQVRLDRVNFEASKRRRPGKTELAMTKTYRAHVEVWPQETKDVLARILEFQEAVRLLSGRYFSGEEILFPEAREGLAWNLEIIGNLEEQYYDSILGGVPEDDKGFQTYIVGLLDRNAEVSKRELPAVLGPGSPDVSGGAKALAEQFILMAKAEALEKLGECRAAEALAEKLVREHVS